MTELMKNEYRIKKVEDEYDVHKYVVECKLNEEGWCGISCMPATSVIDAMNSIVKDIEEYAEPETYDEIYVTVTLVKGGN